MLTYRTTALFLTMLLLIGLPFFFFGGPGYHSSRSFQSTWDLGHILFFAVLSCLLNLYLCRRYRYLSAWFRFVLIFSVVFVIGLTVELLQMGNGNRTPSVLDMLRNQLGCLFAYAFLLKQESRRVPWRWLFRVTVLLLLLLAVWPLTRALIDENLAARQFPVLSDFETPFERYRWVNTRQLRQEADVVRHGRKAARVQLSTAKFSGVSLFYFPGDWRGYERVQWSVYNPQTEPLELHCRIHDNQHKEHGYEFNDRFNQQFNLKPGWNDLAVSLEKVQHSPKDRLMDLQHIEGFGIFVIQQKVPLEIYLDHVHLSK